MQYVFSEEQQAFRESFRAAIAKEGSRRAPYDSGSRIDASLWKTLLAIGLDDLIGGEGDATDLALVAEELGFAAAAVPFVSHAAAVRALAAMAPSDSVAHAEIGTCCSIVAPGMPAMAEHSIELTGLPGERRVSGTIPLLFDGSAATSLLIVTGVERPEAVLLRKPEITAVDSVDRTRPFGTITVSGQPVRTIATGDQVRIGVDLARALSTMLLAADAAGICQAALQMSSQHALTRRQFGQPIGRFQAIKHKLADMLVATENARSAVYAAAWGFQDGLAVEQLTSMAKAVASHAAVQVTSAAIQLHGGIGITWESDLHIYLRRAKTDSLVMGDEAYHLGKIAAHLLDDIHRDSQEQE